MITYEHLLKITHEEIATLADQAGQAQSQQIAETYLDWAYGQYQLWYRIAFELGGWSMQLVADANRLRDMTNKKKGAA